MPLSFREAGFCISGGADPLVGVPSGPGRPRPALCVGTQAPATVGKPARGPAADQGGPPHNLCLSSELGKLSDIGLKPAPPGCHPNLRDSVAITKLGFHSARHAALAAASRCVGIMAFPEDTAGVTGPLHGIPACPFGLQHAIGYCGRVDLRSPGLHASTSAISISFRSNWLTSSLSETPLRTAIAERRICSSRSR